MSSARLANLLATLLGTGQRLAVVVDSILLDASGNPAVKTSATASAVNEVTVTNSITGQPPVIASSGTDTHVGLRLSPKGSAGVVITGPMATKRVVTTVNTAGAGTYSAAAIAGGLILRDTAGDDRTDTTSAAAHILAEFWGAQVGSSFFLIVRNTAGAAETITIAGGTGVTISGTATIGQGITRIFCGVFTNVTSGSEALTLYSI